MQRNRMMNYLIGAAAIAVVLSALGVPLVSFLPFVFLLACPLMMVIMMRGGHGHGGSHQDGGHDHSGQTPTDQT